MSEQLTDADLAAMRARCDAATPGEWEHYDETGDGKSQLLRSVGDDGWCRFECCVDSDDCDGDMAIANAKFVAAARTDLPKCLDEIQNLRSALAGQAAEIEKLRAENEIHIRSNIYISRVNVELDDELATLRQSTMTAELLAEVRSVLKDCKLSVHRDEGRLIDSVLSKLPPAQKEATT